MLSETAILMIAGEEKVAGTVVPAHSANRKWSGDPYQTKVQKTETGDQPSALIYSMEVNFKTLRSSLEIFSNKVHELKRVEPGGKENLLRNVEELKSLHDQMLLRIRSRLIELTGNGFTMISLKPKDSQMEVSNSRHFHDGLELQGDLLDLVKEKLSTELIERLNGLLHGISSCEIYDKIVLQDAFHQSTLKLQRMVLQTIDYMYKYGLITKKTLRHFFGMKKTLETSAKNLILTFQIQMGFPNSSFYHCNKVVLNNPYSSHAISILQGLDNKQQRYFVYLCLKEHFTHHYKEILEKEEYWMNKDLKPKIKELLGLFFEDSIIFTELERYLQIKSLEVQKKDGLKKYNWDNVNIKDFFQELSNVFLQIETLKVSWERFEGSRLIFFILDFVQEFYDGVFEFEKVSPLLREKLNSMYSQLNLFETMC